MSKKNIEEIKKSMNLCSIKLRTIFPLLNDNRTVLNEKFNRILIEKAVLRDKLIKEETPLFVKLKKIIVKKSEKKLICDYFK